MSDSSCDEYWKKTDGGCRQCLPEYAICDGYANCNNGEDEQQCESNYLINYLTNTSNISTLSLILAINTVYPPCP